MAAAAKLDDGLRPAGRLRGRAGTGRAVQAVPGGRSRTTGRGTPARWRRRWQPSGSRRRNGHGRRNWTGCGPRASGRKAELQAAEQRKRRRVQLALAGAVLLLVAGGGAFAWWQDRQASQRNAEALQRQIEDDRELSSEKRSASPQPGCLRRLAGSLREGLREDDAETAGPGAGGGPEALAEGGTEGFAAGAERCRTDLAMLQELDRIDDFRWTPVENKLPDRSAVAARWEQAFGEFGIVPGTTAPAEAARRLADSLIRERLLGALDLWLSSEARRGWWRFWLLADPDRIGMPCGRPFGSAVPGWCEVLAAAGAAMEQPPGSRLPWIRPQLPAERRRGLLPEGGGGAAG